MKVMIKLLTLTAILALGAGCTTTESTESYMTLDEAEVAYPELNQAYEAYFDGIADTAKSLAYSSDDIESIAIVVVNENKKLLDEYIRLLHVHDVMDPWVRKGYIDSVREREVREVMGFILKYRSIQNSK